MGDISQDIEAGVRTGDFQALVARIPYAGFLGLAIETVAGEHRYVMHYRDALIGNTRKPALHGGAIAGFLELAMQLEVLISLAQPRLPYSVDFTIDYLRSGAAADCYAACQIVRSGQRIAQVRAECWQAAHDKPIASARTDFLLRPLGAAPVQASTSE